MDKPRRARIIRLLRDAGLKPTEELIELIHQEILEMAAEVSKETDEEAVRRVMEQSETYQFYLKRS